MCYFRLTHKVKSYKTDIANLSNSVLPNLIYHNMNTRKFSIIVYCAITFTWGECWNAHKISQEKKYTDTNFIKEILFTDKSSKSEIKYHSNTLM